MQTIPLKKKTESSFTLTKSSSLTDVTKNQSFNYYITLTNNTSSIATVTSITDQLPSNFSPTSGTVKIGSNSPVTLLSSDYTLSSGNTLVVSSLNGDSITVPANSSTILTITGSFN